MKTHNSLFARTLDRLSGTHPNDERTSHINEMGFALCGLVYIPTIAIRTVRLLHSGDFRTNTYADPSCLAPPVLAVMVLIMLCITLWQRRKETPLQNKTQCRLQIAELPRAAAALLSGKSPEDERTVLAFERGFAVCGLLGILFYAVNVLFLVYNQYGIESLWLLCAAPVLIAYVKLRKNIMTPPRFGHIKLNMQKLLLRLPVYLIAALPYLAFRCYLPALFDFIGNLGGDEVYSSNLVIMFFQLLRGGFIYWIHNPQRIEGNVLRDTLLIYLLVVLINEVPVFIYRKQMQKMDAEENDLS